MHLRPAISLLFALSALVAIGCPKTEESTKKDESDKKKKSDDDDDDEKKSKKKKKKADDEGEEKKKADEESEQPPPSEDAGAADKGRGGDKASVIDPTTPIPPGCAPAEVGKLGAKPKYITSAGQPGASLAVWASASDTAMKGPFAMTISADGKCYVYYEKPRMEQERAGATLQNAKFDKGAIQAVNGIDDKGNTFVGFRVAYSTTWNTTSTTVTQNEALFFGYVSAGSVPYSCSTPWGEPKSSACAMYHTPLHVFEKETCAPLAGAPPTLASVPPTLTSAAPPKILAAPSTIASIPKLKLGGVGLVPSSSASSSAKPLASATTAPPPAASSSAKVADGCSPENTCEAKGALVKEPKHTFVRILAGALPNKCPASRHPIAPHQGETWYFEGNHWVKR